MNEPSQYLSKSEGWYRIISGGVPICIDKRTAAEAVAVATMCHIKLPTQVWDGDVAAWRVPTPEEAQS